MDCRVKEVLAERRQVQEHCIRFPVCRHRSTIPKIKTHFFLPYLFQALAYVFCKPCSRRSRCSYATQSASRMVSISFQFRWQQALVVVGTISILLSAIVHVGRSGSGSIHPIEIRNVTNLVHDGPKDVLARTAVAFGSKHVVDSFRLHQRTDANNRSLVKRAGTLSYETAWANGAGKLQRIQQGNPHPPIVVQEDFDDSGWTIADDFDREIPKGLTSMAEALKIFPKPEDIHRVEAHQYSEFTNQNGDRHSGDVST